MPELRLKLGATVVSHRGGRAEQGNPGAEGGHSYVGSTFAVVGRILGPSGKAVTPSKDVGVTLV